MFGGAIPETLQTPFCKINFFVRHLPLFLDYMGGNDNFLPCKSVQNPMINGACAEPKFIDTISQVVCMRSPQLMSKFLQEG